MNRSIIGIVLRVVGVAGLVGLCAAVGASAWVRRTGTRGMYESAETVPSRPVAIVLGAMVFPSGQPSDVLEDRLATALDLYRRGKVRRVLVTGDHLTPEYDETNAMRAWLIERGVADRDIFMDHAGLRTLDSMERASRVFLVHEAIVCTQRFHLPRSLFLARRAGIDAVGVVADRRRYVGRHHDQGREFLARAVAFADSYLLGTRARWLGHPIPITGDAHATHDAWSTVAAR